MRWPLRNQIFLPFAGLLAVSVILVTVVSALYAARNSRQQKLQHLESVTTSLGESGFPLAPNVVERIAPMIDGDVVVIDTQSRITASTLPTSTELAEQLTALSTDRLKDEEASDSLQTASLTWDSREYLVSMVRHRHVARVQTLYVLVPQEDFLALQRDSILPPLIVAVPTLILALLLAMMISGRIGGRVHRLKELFRLLSLGNFQTVSVAGRHDELRDLLMSANELADRLNQMREELLLAERLQLLGQLSGGLAHQLKNSITGARLAVQLHQKKSLPESADSQMLDTAIAQLRLTEEQVQAVLSLRPGLEHTTNEKTDLCALIQEVKSLLSPQCEHWKSEISLTFAEQSLPVVLRSPACMKGALLNLVLNAIEAAGIGGSVEIQVAPHTDTTLRIQILDDGPGFKLDPQKLTEAFLTTKQEGIGLGLTIAMHAVEQEQGKLQMERLETQTCVKILLPAPVTAEVQG